MKSRICMLVVLWLGLMPLSMSAQDDMYFIPKKKTQSETTEKKQVQEKTVCPENGKAATGTVLKNTPVYSFSYVDEVPGEENGRDVDEYNRRYRYEDPSVDSSYVAEEDDSLLGSEDGEWVGGFDGSDEDYEYSKRLLTFWAPTVGVPVSSPLYWDLCYGPNSIYWNVYDDGFYAYIFPTAWNPYYYSPWRLGYWWDFGYGYPYWGWGGYYWGWHHPHHYWPYYSGHYYASHPSYRVNRPSLGRTGVTRRTISGSPVRGTTGVRGSSTGRGGVIRGARVGGSSVETQQNDRGSRVVIPRRSTERVIERSNSNTSRPVIERSTPSRIGSGSRIGGGFGGGFGGSRGGGRGGVTRGAR